MIFFQSCGASREMNLLAILYEGLILCSLLDPTENIIIGDSIGELKPGTEVGSSRFCSEGQIA